MTRPTRKLVTLTGVAVLTLASGVTVAHAVGGTAETKNDCLIIASGTTGQTSCPPAITASASGSQIFNLGAGALVDTCTAVWSTLSPTVQPLQGLAQEHIQTPQFDDVTTGLTQSTNSFDSGSTVTYTANTVSDTKNTFPAGFAGQTIEAVDLTTSPFTAVSGTVSTVTAHTLTLTANWTTQPSAGSAYQVDPCTDNLGGDDMTVTTNGWSIGFLDAATDEGSAEGAGTSTSSCQSNTCDELKINVPKNGAIVYNTLGCEIDVNPTGPGPYGVIAGYDDNTTLGVPGTGTSGAIPITVSGALACPTTLSTAAYTGNVVFNQTVRDN